MCIRNRTTGKTDLSIHYGYIPVTRQTHKDEWGVSRATTIMSSSDGWDAVSVQNAVCKRNRMTVDLLGYLIEHVFQTMNLPKSKIGKRNKPFYRAEKAASNKPNGCLLKVICRKK